MLVILVLNNEILSLCSCTHKDMISHLSWLVVSWTYALIGKVVVVHICKNHTNHPLLTKLNKLEPAFEKELY